MAGFLSSVARQFLLWDLLAVPFAVSCDFSRGRLIVLSSFTVTVKGFGEPGKTGTPAPFCASLPKNRLVKATENESRFHSEDPPRFAGKRPDFPPCVLLRVLRHRPDYFGVQSQVCNGCEGMFIIVRHHSVYSHYTSLDDLVADRRGTGRTEGFSENSRATCSVCIINLSGPSMSVCFCKLRSHEASIHSTRTPAGGGIGRGVA